VIPKAVDRSHDRSDDAVPVELAEGPNVRVWADPELLARIDAMESTHPDRFELIFQCILSARGNWSRAVSLWADDEGLPSPESRSMIIHRMPTWS
jgi:hypothetical protein